MKIRQGAQTGVDVASADVVLELARPDLTLCGWAPYGWKREDGVIPTRYREFMREAPPKRGGYSARTTLNVRDSDAVFLIYRARGGVAQDHRASRWDVFGPASRRS